MSGVPHMVHHERYHSFPYNYDGKGVGTRLLQTLGLGQVTIIGMYML